MEDETHECPTDELLIETENVNSDLSDLDDDGDEEEEESEEDEDGEEHSRSSEHTATLLLKLIVSPLIAIFDGTIS